MDNSSGLTPNNIAGLIPNTPNNHWYSYVVGPVTFISMSTEAYFFYQGYEAQYAYMDSVLSKVDRSATPWVIVYGHRSISKPISSAACERVFKPQAVYS